MSDYGSTRSREVSEGAVGGYVFAGVIMIRSVDTVGVVSRELTT